MRAAATALKTLLASGATQFTMTNLYTITLLNGSIYTCTDADYNVLTSDGRTFLPTGAQMQGMRYSIKVGAEVDEQDLTIAAYPTDLIDGQPFLTALQAGLFDDATFQWERAFLPTVGQQSTGEVILFYGYISTISDLGRTSAKVKVKSMLGRLDRPWPRNTYAAACQWVLYGYGCGLSKASYTGTATVASGTTAANILLTGASFSDASPYALGTIAFTSGALSGTTATLKTTSNSPLSVVPASMLPSAPAPGTTCTLAWGCDHTLGSGGCAKFSNTARYRGCPYVPPPSVGL